MLFEEAHLEASSSLTSLPSATVARSCVPRPRPSGLFEVEVEETEEGPLKGKDEEVLLDILDGVVGGTEVSMRFAFSQASTLFPTSSRVRSGDARARASFMKEGREVNVEWEVMS